MQSQRDRPSFFAAHLVALFENFSPLFSLSNNPTPFIQELDLGFFGSTSHSNASFNTYYRRGPFSRTQNPDDSAKIMGPPAAVTIFQSDYYGLGPAKFFTTPHVPQTPPSSTTRLGGLCMDFMEYHHFLFSMVRTVVVGMSLRR
jgi:hypothetical protein